LSISVENEPVIAQQNPGGARARRCLPRIDATDLVFSIGKS
jgi:hypothetical protein